MESFRSLFRILSRLGRRRAAILLTALLVNSLLEGLGIATVLPLLFMATGNGFGDKASPLARHIVDFMQTAGLPVELWSLALLAGSLLMAREVISFVIRTYAGFVIADITAEHRRRLLDRLTCASWPFFQARMLGGLNISLAQFTEYAAMTMDLAVIAATTIVRTLLYILLVIVISGPLATIAAVAGVVLFSPLFALIYLARRYSTRYRNFFEKLSAQFSDIFASIKVVKAMALEDTVQPLFDRVINKLNRIKHKTVLVTYGLQSLQNLAAVILVFGLLYVAVTWLKISVVEIGLLGGLTLTIVKNLSKSQNLLQKIALMEPYLWRLEEMIADASAACEKPGGRPAPSLERGIRFDDVGFSYPDRPVFDHLDLDIPARRITVLIGPSGSGKTTVADLVMGLYLPQTGRILIDDVPLSEIDLKDWRRHIGYVPQELVLLSGSVRDNITLGAKADDGEVWRALELAGAAAFVRELPAGLDTEVGERGVKLSGGQRQRLSLARALVRRPRLLILDEVTSALDPETERRLVAQIGALGHGERITVLAITHTQAWRQVADHVLRIEAGRVIRETTSPTTTD